MPRRRMVRIASVAGLAAAAVAVPTTAAQVKQRSLFGVMLGTKEVAADGSKRAGDLNGRGSASAVIDGGQLCFGLTVMNIDTPAAAHIHKGNRNKNGPVVLPLTPPSSGDPGASSGCVEVDSALARAILKNPRKYYWNVHTAAFPGGAVRGQVFIKRK